MTAVTPKQRHTVLKMSEKLGFTAETCAKAARITTEEAVEIRAQAGHPNVDSVRRARIELEREIEAAGRAKRVRLASATHAAARPEPAAAVPERFVAPAPAPVTPAEPVLPPPPIPLPAGRVIAPTLQRLPIGDVHPDPANPRGSLPDVEGLAESMRDVGLLQPIVVRRDPSGDLVIVAGHRRHAAALLLGWAELDVILRTDLRSDDVLMSMLIENGQRADLDPIEEARAIRRLMSARGLETQEQAGKAIGKSGTYVSARLALLALTSEQQDQVRAGVLTLGQAVEKVRTRFGGGAGSRGGTTAVHHFGAGHPLADTARGRCARLKHKTGRLAGGVACGSCWEAVIRSDAARAAAPPSSASVPQFQQENP